MPLFQIFLVYMIGLRCAQRGCLLPIFYSGLSYKRDSSLWKSMPHTVNIRLTHLRNDETTYSHNIGYRSTPADQGNSSPTLWERASERHGTGCVGGEKTQFPQAL
jgi:hypothetical protein